MLPKAAERVTLPVSSTVSIVYEYFPVGFRPDSRKVYSDPCHQCAATGPTVPTGVVRLLLR